MASSLFRDPYDLNIPPRNGVRFHVQMDHLRNQYMFKVDKDSLNELGSEAYLERLYETFAWYVGQGTVDQTQIYSYMSQAKEQVGHLVDKYGEEEIEYGELHVDALLDAAKVFKQKSKRVIKPMASRGTKKSFWENSAFSTTYTNSAATTTNKIKWNVPDPEWYDEYGEPIPAQPASQKSTVFARLDKDVEKTTKVGRKILAGV